jgi:hypothetical protein
MDQLSRIAYFENLVRREPYSHKDINYKGEKQKLPVHEINVDYLVYNRWNGRISSLVKSNNMETGIELDPTEPEGIKIIEEFLWKSNVPANKATKKSIWLCCNTSYRLCL